MLPLAVHLACLFQEVFAGHQPHVDESAIRVVDDREEHSEAWPGGEGLRANINKDAPALDCGCGREPGLHLDRVRDRRTAAVEDQIDSFIVHVRGRNVQLGR